MLRAGVGLSTERDSARAAAEAAGIALRSADLARADVLFVFATTAHGPGFTRVTRTAAEVCGTAQVVGCSAAGVLVGEDEVEGGPGVAVLALAGDFAVRRFFVPLVRGGAERVADDIRAAVGPGEGDEPLLFLFGDTYHLEPEPLFQALKDDNPNLVTVSRGYREPVCFHTDVNIARGHR